METGNTDEEGLAQALEGFMEAQRGPTPPSAEAWASRHPAVQDQLLPLCRALQVLEESKHEGWAAPHGMPRRVGPYRLVREIGRGGMGVVYEAVRDGEGDSVALKVLSSWAPSHLAQERFRREWAALSTLRHPHIVRGKAFGCEEEIAWVAMELESGYTLGRLPEPWMSAPRDPRWFRQVAQWMAEASQALDHAHAQGILHRDIKPTNLLLDAHGHVRVSDFGVAHVPGTTGLTEPGAFVGTARYAAPEQWTGACEPSTDLYALGATAYELLTGTEFPRSPGAGLGWAADPRSAAAGPDPRDRSPNIPRNLAAILIRCTALLPVHRYPTARSLSADLEAFLTGRPLARSTRRARRSGVRWHTTVAAATLLLVTTWALSTFAGMADQSDALERAQDDIRVARQEAREQHDGRERAERDRALAASRSREARLRTQDAVQSLVERSLAHASDLQQVGHGDMALDVLLAARDQVLSLLPGRLVAPWVRHQIGLPELHRALADAHRSQGEFVSAAIHRAQSQRPIVRTPGPPWLRSR